MDDQFAFRYSSVICSEDSELEECCGDVGALSAGAVSDADRYGVYDGNVGWNDGNVGWNDGDVGINDGDVGWKDGDVGWNTGEVGWNGDKTGSTAAGIGWNNEGDMEGLQMSSGM